MPTLKLSWRRFTPQSATPYTIADVGGPAVAIWIIRVQWRLAGGGAGGALIGRSPGVYIIENNVDSPIYAGMAEDIRDRFDSRSNTLHELGFTAANLVNYSVRTASVVSTPRSFVGRIELAEQWLVRFLFLRDADPVNAPRQLQNVELTDTFLAPADGLRIRFAAAGAPAYLNDNNADGWVHVGAAGLAAFGYNYAPNAAVLP